MTYRFADLLAEPAAYRVDLVRRRPKGYDDHALHVLVIERCHDDDEHPESEEAQDRFCWDPEWEVLHPPTCYRTNELADEDQHGPQYRCGLDWDLESRGEDVFSDSVPPGPEGDGIAERLPAGRYLIRWSFEESLPGAPHWEYDYRSGADIIPGPVPEDLPGWQ